MFHTLSILAGFPPSFVRPTTCVVTQSRGGAPLIPGCSPFTLPVAERKQQHLLPVELPLFRVFSTQQQKQQPVGGAYRAVCCTTRPIVPGALEEDRRTDGRADGGGEVTCPMPPHRKNATASCFCSLLGGESTSCSEREGSDEVIEWWLVAVAVAASDQQGEKL